MTEDNKVSELTNGEFEEFIKDGITLIDFFAEWCMPCLMLAPVVEEMSKKFDGKIKFGKVDIDSNREFAQKFGINSIPNLVVFKDGEVLEQFVGLMSAEDLEEKLKKFI